MKAQEGFTLIEVLISMAVLSFGMLAVASMQTVAIRVNSFSNRLTEGATLVQDKIEELMGLPFNDPNLSDPTPGVGPCQSYTDPPSSHGYTVGWCVDLNAAGTSKTVNVTASWRNLGQLKSFSLSFVRTIFQ
jgi:prepilin-type N-terminal cleavage/methylation domain-containing protein